MTETPTPISLFPPIARGEWVRLAILMTLAALFHLCLMNFPFLRCDDVFYIVGAKSLLAGHGYADISQPAAPLLTKYAPLCSVTLLPFLPLVGDDIRLLRPVSELYLLLSIPLFYGMLRARTSPRSALWCIALFLFNPYIVQQTLLMSNTGWNILVSTTVLFGLDRIYRVRPTLKTILLCAVLLAVFCYTHRTAVAMVAATLAYLTINKRQLRAAGTLLIFVLLLFFPWMLRSHTATGHWLSPEYEGEVQARIWEDTPSATDSSAQGGVMGASVRHILVNLKSFPIEVGHGLFPWSKGSGGGFWQPLARLGLSWLQPVTLGGIVLLMLIGWASAFRRGPTLIEWSFASQTAMLLLFFIGFQYYALLIPFLFLYVWQGVQVVLDKMKAPAHRRVLAQCGAWILLLPAVGKDAFAMLPHVEPYRVLREARWQWVVSYVPEGQAVYWQDLANYAWSQWRWFDTQRVAAGLTEDQIRKAIQEPASSVRYIGVPSDAAVSADLKAAGWTVVYTEPDSVVPNAALIRRNASTLRVAQMAYLEALPPPQTLWRRPATEGRSKE